MFSRPADALDVLQGRPSNEVAAELGERITAVRNATVVSTATELG